MNVTRKFPVADPKAELQRLVLLAVLIGLMIFLAVHVGNLAANYHEQTALVAIAEPDDSPFCYKSCTLIHP